ncbi:MAG: FadR family transcriptional regulator [Spirochaetes bacterium]|nr:FadR family transcriptional regulator [Spirochaetota bacterium]
MFQQAKQRRAFQDVIYQIEEAIIHGKLQAGDKLPAERELKELFQTSRGTLREALRVLEQKGLVRIKTGVNGGAFIREVTTHQVSESLALLIRYQKIPLKDLAEFREGVEGIVASFAAERKNGREKQKLGELLDTARFHLESGISHWDEFIDTDNRIHMTVAAAAKNPVYESVLRMVHENIIRYYNRFLEKKLEIMEENFKDLCSIVRTIEAGDKEGARLAAEGHVKRFNRYMEEGKGSGPS